MDEYELVPKHLFNYNLKKDEIDEELLRLYIQKIKHLDTSNANMCKYKLRFTTLRKNLNSKARAVTKGIIIQEVSKHSSTPVTEFKQVIQWYKNKDTTEEEKLQCIYTVFTNEVVEAGLAKIMEAEKIRYLDAHALQCIGVYKKIRGHGFIGDLFTKQIKARRDTVSLSLLYPLYIKRI